MSFHTKDRSLLVEQKPRKRSRPRRELAFEQAPEVAPQRQYDRTPEGWDLELTQDEFPLAPKKLKREKKVKKRNYKIQSGRIGKFAKSSVISALDGMTLVGKLVALIGVGELRERELIVALNAMGVSVVAFDFSSVACDNWQKRTSDIPKTEGVRNRIHRVDIVTLFDEIPENLQINPILAAAWEDLNLADAIYCGQVIQVLCEADKDIVMRGFGSWIQRRADRKVVLVHAFGQDNLGEEWGFTIPYSLNELMEPANAAAGRTLITFGLDNKGGFYHHVYTGFGFM